jgi:UDP-3-O-[3-hydroxymyristoyl] N-acetylglucosamine deacetylase
MQQALSGNSEVFLQNTLKSDVVFTGVGLHCGRDVTLRVRPAAAQTGIWFRRTDIFDTDPFISANWQFAVHTALCTRLVNSDGLGVSTVEHVMAAIAGCGINNAILELDGPEVPIMDGSALEFVRGFLKAGLIEQAAPVQVLEILQTVEVQENGAYAALMPFGGIEMDFSIDFPDAAIGKQSKTLNLANGSFVHELCDSRTFCRNSDVQVMRSNGLALGGTLMNAVVIEGADVLSPGGMRHPDEPVRHKMLDAMGDLALAGGPIIGRYVGRRAGHTLTNKLLRKLFAQTGAFRWMDCDAHMSERLPGAGLVQEDAQNYA